MGSSLAQPSPPAKAVFYSANECFGPLAITRAQLEVLPVYLVLFKAQLDTSCQPSGLIGPNAIHDGHGENPTYALLRTRN
jgi:hypothetical protein